MNKKKENPLAAAFVVIELAVSKETDNYSLAGNSEKEFVGGCSCLMLFAFAQ